ncbi:MAG: hypothetical protein IIB13_01575 [Chloroflexi bacterium]|nr:hypothetical protein [Chloroflexota bacterium]
MKIVCAWCGKSLGKKDGRGEKGVSHGLCRECLARMEAAAKKRVSENGDSEPPPPG